MGRPWVPQGMGGWYKQGPPPLAAAPPNFLFTAATESQFFLPSHYDHHGNRTGVCSNRLIEPDIKLQGCGHQFQDPGSGPASPPGKDKLPHTDCCTLQKEAQ